MARWWSSTRKPSTSSGENDTTGSVTPEPEGGHSQSRFKRSLFRSSRPKKEEPPRDEPAHLHRPFTQQNMEHQKILNAFAWNFGRRKSSHGAHSYASGVSPSASRTTSVDGSSLSQPRSHGDRREAAGRFRGSLAGEVPPKEMPDEESDKDQVPTTVLPGSVPDPARQT